ncbi:MAG TPA: HRDC domain-containing protein [Thermoanaerobaculaceae bacterium]|nr:HRDC domain-containing protein [Thermoanaerobaculaceae bacterium]HRS16148.1 HRDC domain-containing protein [Thermoanaerobaculaceae bacterium]
MSRATRWVVEGAELARLCERARSLPRVAVDTEADSFHVYRSKLCLVQVLAGDSVWLVDPLALGAGQMAPLVELLGDPRVEKIMHGADYDLRVLNRELGARVRGLADTQLAAQLGGARAFGLAALLEQELGVQVDKRFQRANWGERPLSAELRAYAAGDVGHLEALADRLRTRLESLGRLEWWREECAALEKVFWEEAPPDPFAFLRVKGASTLRGAARDRLAALWAWREAQAAARDCPPFRVLQPETLLQLASRPPADLKALGEVRGVGKGLVAQHGRELLAVLASPPPAPEQPRVPPPPRDKLLQARVSELRAVRDTVAAELGIDGGVLAPRAALEAVAEARPASPEALVACLGRRWRTSVLAPRVLPLIAGWSEE